MFDVNRNKNMWPQKVYQQAVLVFLLCKGLCLEVVAGKYVVRIGTIEKNSSSSALSMGRSGAAIDMALEYIRQKYNDTLDIRYSSGFAPSGPTEAGAVAAELYYKHNVDAFIGPGSSTSVEAMGHLVTQWNLPIITPAGGSGTLADKTLYPTLTRMSPISVESYSFFILKMIDKYSWNHYVILHSGSVARLHWYSMEDILKSDNDYSWSHYEIDEDTFTETDYERVLTDASKYARVFVLLTNAPETRDIMLVAHRLGFTNGEYVMMVTKGLDRSIDEGYWRYGDDNDEAAKKAFQSCLFFTGEPVSSAFAAFEQEVKERSLRDYNFDYYGTNTSVHFLTASYYDSFVMFGHVLNETVVEGGDPRDGRAFAHRLWNRTYPGVTGSYKINSGGSRDSEVYMHDLDPSTGAFKLVSRYIRATDSLTIVDNIHWPGGRPPSDIPKCGFRNDRCLSTGPSDSLTIGLSSAFGVILVVASVIASFIIWRWKKKSEADMWWWKIDSSDLKMSDGKKTGSCIMSFTSRISILTAKEDTPFMDYMTDTAVYKGQIVRLRKLTLKNQTFNKSLLSEFKQLRDLNQGNIAKVVGACLDNTPKYLVTEFCSKGTLQDLLGNTRLPLDTHFKFSLSIDIAQGMTFLHNSSIHCHGHLNSATCLIDNRFSVKLTDVGVPCIFDNIVVDKHSQEYKLECLWKSPEELRDPSKRGSQFGDVYSFGIILQEIITREAPFFEETDTIGVDGVLHKVKRGGVPSFRPKISVPDNMRDLSTLMETCWEEDPSRRPQFHTIRKALKSLAARFGASGSLMDSLLRRMEQYANNLEKLVDEKTVELQEEKKKSEELLYQILPRSVANSLRQGFKVDPEDFENVTIYFSDICGFTTISAMSTPFQVVDLLNDLYTCFDAVIDRFDVYKVETIGDAYMVVSGLPQKNGNRHASEIARMSLALLKEIETFKIRHLPNERLLLRIGLHSGPVVAGVVGLKMPRYCLFGDTVNTASRMESHGEELKVHMSGNTAMLLQRFEIFNVMSRGCIEIKGKGLMETFWLLGVTAA